MEISYCDKWSNLMMGPSNMIDEKTAKNNHLNKIDYTVIVRENGEIKCIIDMAKEFVSVNFLNSKLQKYLCYIFCTKSNNRMFLKTTYFYEYNKDSSIEKGIIFNFEENGHTEIEEKDWKTGHIKKSEYNDDVSLNWEKYPYFGDYDKLCEKER